MKKMPCLFVRDFSTSPPTILREVTPGCEWVVTGIGRATRKWDGTAVAIINGVLYARYDAKRGKPVPDGAVPCDKPDPVTGHHPHWVRADRPQDVWIREACGEVQYRADGTYEAVGPKIGGNPERLERHALARHGEHVFFDVERTFDGLCGYLANHQYEGVVFHHPDGQMCKIRRDDFGLPWPIVGE
jgi:hypothetical protein